MRSTRVYTRQRYSTLKDLAERVDRYHVGCLVLLPLGDGLYLLRILALFLFLL